MKFGSPVIVHLVVVLGDTPTLTPMHQNSMQDHYTGQPLRGPLQALLPPAKRSNALVRGTKHDYKYYLEVSRRSPN